MYFTMSRLETEKIKIKSNRVIFKLQKIIFCTSVSIFFWTHWKKCATNVF